MNNFLKNKKKKTLDNDVKKENFSRMRDISEFMELCRRVFFCYSTIHESFLQFCTPWKWEQAVAHGSWGRISQEAVLSWGHQPQALTVASEHLASEHLSSLPDVISLIHNYQTIT